MAMRKLISGLALLACLGLSGCEETENQEISSPTRQPSQIIPEATTNDPFAIIWPASGEVLTNGHGSIYLKGVGLNTNKLSSLKVRVHTNQPYDQPGKPIVTSNWSWKHHIHLGGQGRYNNHTIEAIAFYNDGTRSVSTVRGVVRADTFRFITQEENSEDQDKSF